MILRQVLFTLTDLENPVAKAREAIDFQESIESLLGAYPKELLKLRIDGVDIESSAHINDVLVAYDSTEYGTLLVNFTDKTVVQLKFNDSDILTVYIHEDTLNIDVKGPQRY